MQLSNLNLASKSSMKMYFFVGTSASLLLIQLLPHWTSCMTIQKEFTGGHWRPIELYICSCDLVSEVFKETYQGHCVYRVISLIWGDICNWLSVRPKYSTLSGQKNAQYLTFHWWQMRSRVACLCGTERFLIKSLKINMDFIFYGINILAMQLTSQTAHPFTLKNQMHIKVTHTRQHTFRID